MKLWYNYRGYEFAYMFRWFSVDIWKVQADTLSLHPSDMSMPALFLTDCMRLCQTFACLSLRHDSDSRTCYLRTVHTSHDDVLLDSNSNNVMAVDRFQFRGKRNTHTCTCTVKIRLPVSTNTVLLLCYFRLQQPTFVSSLNC